MRQEGKWTAENSKIDKPLIPLLAMFHVHDRGGYWGTHNARQIDVTLLNCNDTGEVGFNLNHRWEIGKISSVTSRTCYSTAKPRAPRKRCTFLDTRF